MTRRDPLDDLAVGMVAAARDAVQKDSRLRRRAAAKLQSGPAVVVGYVRVSTEEQGDAGAGMEAQRRAITAACHARGWRLAAIHEDVASGTAFTKRSAPETPGARGGEARPPEPQCYRRRADH